MKFRDAISVAFRGLTRHWLRATLNVIGIVAGVASVMEVAQALPEGTKLVGSTGIPVALAIELFDPRRARLEHVEMVLLVAGSHRRQHLAERGRVAGDLLSHGNPSLQRDQVPARQVVAEVGGRVDGATIFEVSHQPTILSRRRVRSRGSGCLTACCCTVTISIPSCSSRMRLPIAC